MILNNSTKKTKMYIYICAVLIFCFARMIVFTDREQIGYDFSNMTSYFQASNAMFFVLSALYSILTTVLMVNVYKKCENKAWLPCVLLLIDPCILVMQQSNVNLLICVLWLLYFNIRLADKTIVISRIFQVLFLIAITSILPYTAFSFAALVILIEIVTNIKNIHEILKEKTTIITIVVALLSAGFGLVLNKIFVLDPRFTSFINFLNPTEIDTDHSILITFFVLSIPSIVFGVYFISLYIKRCKCTKPGQKKTKKQEQKNSKEINKVKILAIVVSLAFLLLIIGGVFFGYQALGTIGILIPVVIIALLCLDTDKIVEDSMFDIEQQIFQHPLAFAVIFMLTHFVSIQLAVSQLRQHIDTLVDFFVFLI